MVIQRFLLAAKRRVGRVARFLGRRAFASEPHAQPEERDGRHGPIEAPVVEGEFERQAVFAGTDPRTSLIQKRVALAALGLVGGDYIPGRLARLLRRFSAFEAIDQFLAEFDLTYNQLLQSGEDRPFLAAALDILVETDATIWGTTLDDVRVYDVLRARDFIRAEKLVSRIRAAVDAYRAVHEATIEFPAYARDFRKSALQLIEGWDRLDEGAFDELCENQKLWNDLQREFDRLRARVLDRLRWIDGRAPEDSPVREALPGMVEVAERLAKSGFDGSLEPAAAIEGFRELVRDLEALAAMFHAEEPPGADESSEGSDDGDDGWESVGSFGSGQLSRTEFAAHLLTLEFDADPPLTLRSLRSTFRRAARESHPDMESGSHEAFLAVQAAYEDLKRHLECGFEAYV